MANNGEFIGQEYEVATGGADLKRETKKSRALKSFTTSLFSFSIFLSISAIAFTMIFYIVNIQGSSMMNSVNPTFDVNAGPAEQQRTIDHGLTNRHITPNRGDIIVVDDPRQGRYGLMIKRLIAVGGDSLRLVPDATATTTDMWGATVRRYHTQIRFAGTNEWVYLNEWYLADEWAMYFFGANLYEYINGRNRPYQSGEEIPFRARFVVPAQGGQPAYIAIPQGYMFYMGDNRGGADHSRFNSFTSYDSAQAGPRPMRELQGVVVNIMPEGETFVQFFFRLLGEFFSFGWLFG